MECYGRHYSKLFECKKCQYKSYCKASQDLDKSHDESTRVDQLDLTIDPVTDIKKANNLTGVLLTELLKLIDFCPIKFYAIICRLGSVSYADIGKQLGISGVAVYDYFRQAPPRIKKYLQAKQITMIELEEAFKEQLKKSKRIKKKQPNPIFGRPKKKLAEDFLQNCNKKSKKKQNSDLQQKVLPQVVDCQDPTKELGKQAELASKKPKDEGNNA